MKTLLKSLLFAVIATLGVPAFAAPENHEEFARQYMPESQAVFERFRKDCAETQKLRESLTEDLRVMNRVLASDAGYYALSKKIAELEKRESEWAITIKDAFFKHKAGMITSGKLSTDDANLAKKSLNWERDVLKFLLKNSITSFSGKWCDSVFSQYLFLETVPIPERNYAFGIYEVTISQYRSVMGEIGKQIESPSEVYPVTNVSFEDCVEFCRKLTEQARYLGMISDSWEYRLPFLDEWLHACRANSSTKYYTGDANDTLDDVAWYKASMWDEGMKHPIGQKKPNAFGLYDMIGNVEELVVVMECRTRFCSKLKQCISAWEPVPHYIGGYWNQEARTIHNSMEKARPLHFSKSILRGFRVVLAPVEKPKK